ncbi:sialidase family protein [Tahibacter amnicola]|uniref:Glycoside hydrolase n=1 Tax=Tahibacter amnicola TaxID=2976241 RepID=A0ABY6BM77_9GAMM|nr:sialidase family protein [Tahibacter amnicola]UXI70558.1 glycoside hydrolase [Tahibacter amnicola]
MIRRAAGVIATVLPAMAMAQVAVTSGPGTDYQPAIVRATDGTLVMVFERLNASFSGDLWVSRSVDDGSTWSTPSAVIASSANERHPALVQLGDGSFVLFYLKGSGGASSFRLFRATSADGLSFTEQGTLSLGWTTGGEVNPHVIRHPDGTLTLSYHRLGGSSYVSQSTDNGASWDSLKTAIAPGNSQLPRIAYRASDGRYLVTYQVGSSPLSLYARTTTNIRDWSASAIPLAVDGDNHDSVPVVMPDQAFVVFHIRANGDQYDIYSRRSTDASTFEEPIAHGETDDANDVEPHPLVGTSPNSVQLYWGREHPVGSADFDIYRQPAAPVTDALFDDGFEP